MINASDRNSGRPAERRRFARFETQVPVTTRRDDLLAKGQSASRSCCRLRLQDFSLAGLRAESSVPLKARERVTLRLPPTATQPEMEITGRVVHCRRQDKRYNVGIELCQTREDPLSSPYRQLPRLFSMAVDYAVDGVAEVAASDC
jgi:hypothetical protein